MLKVDPDSGKLTAYPILPPAGISNSSNLLGKSLKIA